MADANGAGGGLAGAVLDTITNLVVVLDCQGRIVRFNRACERATGYAFAEVAGREFFDILLLPEEADAVKEVFRQLAAGHFPNEHENYWLTKAGERRLIAWSNTALVDAAGKVEYVVGTGADVGEQRQAEAALRESEERQRLVLANSPDMVFVQDRELRYTWIINPAPPLRQEDVVGKTDFDLLPAAEAQQLAELKRQVMATGVGTRVDLRLAPGGISRCYETVYEALRDYAGQVVGITAYARDVTKRKRAEEERERLLATLQDLTEQLQTRNEELQSQSEELQSQNEELQSQEMELRRLAQEASEQRQRAEAGLARLEAIIANMGDGVFVCDDQARITLVNEAGARLLGLESADEALRGLAEISELLNVRHPDGRPELPAEMPLARALAGETVVLQAEVFTHPRGKRDVYVRTSACPIRDDQGKIVGAVAVPRDVTELTELDRLKDQFIQVAAHELKTPVTIMKGYAQALLRSGQETSPTRRKMLDAIDRGTDRIERLVNDLLDISKLQSSQMEMVSERLDLQQLVEEQVDRLALTTTKHQVRLVKAQPVVIQGDLDRLEQVLSNLLDNAIRYSPEGGDVDVAVCLEGDEVIVAVADQGVGIPAEKQGRMFERFYRAHTNTPYDYGGMGVGLYISYEIVRRHGGRVWFASEAGVGSTFYFALPLT